jgi:hypothetical protein
MSDSTVPRTGNREMKKYEIKSQTERPGGGQNECGAARGCDA